MKLNVKPLVMAIGIGFSIFAGAQDTHFEPNQQQIPAPDCLLLKAAYDGGWRPCTAEDHEAWLADIRHWRSEHLIRVGYDGSRYDLPALKWTQSSFFQPQMMVQDRYFYDPVSRRYTVGRYLDDLDKRYGGIDAVLIWPTYPNMGIDDRNQHDLIRSMPGGVAGVRQMIADFHQARRARSFSHDDVGPGYARSRKALAAGDCRVDGGGRSRRYQRRYPGWGAARIFSRCRQSWTSAGV
jgi:gamma-glutamyl hercynylcysteine S-oxide synthase